MGWVQSVTDLTLKVAGTTVGSTDGAHPTILSASWGHGREDWFASLAPGTASFEMAGDLTASVSPGATLALAKGAVALWTGKVDTVALSRAPGRPDRTTVTGADWVARLGEARLRSNGIAANDYDLQLSEALSDAGMATTVRRVAFSDIIGPLSAWTYTGSVLDWVDTAERYANAITMPRPDGSLVVCGRSGIPDYVNRVARAGVEAPYDDIPAAVALWPMDEASGNLADLVGIVTGTANGTPGYLLEGPYGAGGIDAIRFDKADAADHFNMGDVIDLATVTSFTLAGWVRCDRSGADAHTVMHKQTSGAADGWRVEISTGGALRFQASAGGSSVCDVSTAAGAIPTNEWAHWAVVRSGATVYLYVDAAQAASGAISGGALPNTPPDLRVGRGFGGSLWYGGRMCAIAVWASALSASDIGRLIAPSHVTLPEPSSWDVARSIAGVINHWRVAGVTYSDATSIATYGRRSWDVDAAPLGAVYSSDLFAVMRDPRPLATGTYHVTDGSSPLITLAPLDLVLYDSTLWQVMRIQHDLSPSTWDVTLTLDRTQNDMTTGDPLLPV